MPIVYTYWQNTEPSWDEPRVPWIIRILVRWAIVIGAFLAAEWFVNNVAYTRDRWYIEDWQALLAATAIFVFVRALVRPILLILTCPLQLITLGLFALVINALVLLLAEKVCHWLSIGFDIDGFWPAFIGALVISIVSFALSRIVRRQPFAKLH
ncbi:MAG: phage holin family protein [Chloroflexota bacterium]